jgi:uncharacterized protein (DUF302 family)
MQFVDETQSASSAIQLGGPLRLRADFDTAIQRVTAALKTEGFGVLTEIDVQATLKAKLGVDFKPYKILGACNPAFAHQALTVAPQTGLLLPCNVVVAEAAPGEVEVSIVDPLAMLGVLSQPELTPVAQAVREKLLRVSATLKE